MIPSPPWKERVWKIENKRVLLFHGMKVRLFQWRNTEVTG